MLCIDINALDLSIADINSNGFQPPWHTARGRGALACQTGRSGEPTNPELVRAVRRRASWDSGNSKGPAAFKGGSRLAAGAGCGHTARGRG